MALVAFPLSFCSAITIVWSKFDSDFLRLVSARLGSAETFSGSFFAAPAPASAYRSMSKHTGKCSLSTASPITKRHRHQHVPLYCSSSHFYSASAVRTARNVECC